MEIIALAAMSLDGFITHGNEPGTAFTSQADKDWFAKTMRDFSVKIMGRKTYEVSQDFILNQIQDNNCDLRFVLTSDPSPFKTWHQPGKLEFTNQTPQQIISSLQNVHAGTKVAVLGGGAVYSAFLNANLLDEFWITLEPQFFGSGTPIATEPSIAKLRLKETTLLAPSTLLLKYLCKNPRS